MDRRSWPWKKKNSDKALTATETNNSSLPCSGDAKADQVPNSCYFLIIPCFLLAIIAELTGKVTQCINRHLLIYYVVKEHPCMTYFLSYL